MNPAELLARITAKAAPLSRIPGAHGRITQQDILCALGCIEHAGEGLLMRVKYAGQAEFVADLDRRYWMAVVDLALEQRWPYPRQLVGQEFFRNLGRMALSEHIRPDACHACGGCGKALLGGKVLACSECRGSGRRRVSDRVRARTIGMPWETFRVPWVQRYRQIQGIAHGWESHALGKISWRLRPEKIA